MRPSRAPVSLTGQVALLSLIPVVALGCMLAWVLRGQIVDRTLADASQSASLVARLGVQPRISQYELEHGLSATGVEALDEQLKARSVTHDLARIKIWNNKGLIVYSDDHALRRTCASVLVALGKDPRYVMAQLGHTDPTVTLGIYARAMNSSDDDRERLRLLVEGYDLRVDNCSPASAHPAEHSQHFDSSTKAAAAQAERGPAVAPLACRPA